MQTATGIRAEIDKLTAQLPLAEELDTLRENLARTRAEVSGEHQARATAEAARRAAEVGLREAEQKVRDQEALLRARAAENQAVDAARLTATSHLEEWAKQVTAVLQRAVPTEPEPTLEEVENG